MPAGSFIIGDSTNFTFTVSSGGSGTFIRCTTSSSVRSQSGLNANDTNFPLDPSSDKRWVKLNTMGITPSSGTANFNVFTDITSNTTSSGGVLPVLSGASYTEAGSGLRYGAVFTSTGSLSLFRTNFSGGEVDTNVSSTTLQGNLRASFTYHTLPYAPSSLSASVSGQTINLSWSPPSDNGGTAVQRYRIEVSENGGAFQLETDTETGTSYSYAADVNTSYVFRVAAITTMVLNLRIAESVPNATGLFETSNTVSVTLNTGKRMTGSSTSTPITIARRFDGNQFVNLTIAKRFDGTNFINLSN